MKIGIVGSSFGLKKKEIEVARDIGKEISKIDSEIFICFDETSLPMIAGKEILKSGKKVVCFCCNKDEETKAKQQGLTSINLNLPRLARELGFVSRIDALIVCGGGSGTLMEVTFAYQMGKPIFLMEEIKGSVETFRKKFLDNRKRIMIESGNVKEIVRLLFKQNRG